MSLESELRHYESLRATRVLSNEELARLNTLRARAGEDVPAWQMSPIGFVMVQGLNTGALVEAVRAEGGVGRGKKVRFKVGGARLPALEGTHLQMVGGNTACGSSGESHPDINYVNCSECIREHSAWAYGGEEEYLEVYAREPVDVEQIEARGIVWDTAYGLPELGQTSRYYAYASPPGKASIYPIFLDEFVWARVMTKKNGRWV